MKKVDKLRQIATELATARGHTLDRFKERCFRSSVVKGRKILTDATKIIRSMSSYCVKCKMPVIVVDNPLDGSKQIDGDATTLNCPNGSAPEDTLMKMSFDAKRKVLKAKDSEDKHKFDKVNKRFGLK